MRTRLQKLPVVCRNVVYERRQGNSFCKRLMGMEEISWGQRIIGWDTPDLWKQINAQHETNFHNFLNPIWIYYPIFNLLVASFMYFAPKIRSIVLQRCKDENVLQLIPHQESPLYAIIFILLAIQSFAHRGELTEEICSIIGLSWAVKHLYFMNHPDKTLNRTS